MKYLLEAMRALHYVVGITAPKPEDERKILFLWIGVLIGLALIGVAATAFFIPHVLRQVR